MRALVFYRMGYDAILQLIAHAADHFEENMFGGRVHLDGQHGPNQAHKVVSRA